LNVESNQFTALTRQLADPEFVQTLYSLVERGATPNPQSLICDDILGNSGPTLVTMGVEPEITKRSVVLVYFEGCPHWQTALGRLEAAVQQVDVGIAVHLQLVTNEEEARTCLMAGSPTILVDGRDPFPGGGAAWGCRLYEGENGPSGSPSVAELVKALL
jgi:hypothetical protein